MDVSAAYKSRHTGFYHVLYQQQQNTHALKFWHTTCSSDSIKRLLHYFVSGCIALDFVCAVAQSCPSSSHPDYTRVPCAFLPCVQNTLECLVLFRQNEFAQSHIVQSIEQVYCELFQWALTCMVCQTWAKVWTLLPEWLASCIEALQANEVCVPCNTLPRCLQKMKLDLLATQLFHGCELQYCADSLMILCFKARELIWKSVEFIFKLKLFKCFIEIYTSLK